MTAIIFAIVNVAKGCKSQSQPEPELFLNSAILRKEKFALPLNKEKLI